MIQLSEVYEISAFTKDRKGGNPAGVVLKTEGLTDFAMQDMAHKAGYSETAFVLPSKIADYQIRYFTPSEEVDVCGHATIATFSLLSQLKQIQPGSFTIETKAGVLKVEVAVNKTVFLQQNVPVFGEILPMKVVAESLGVEASGLTSELPVQIVSTGLRDMIIPIRDLATLMKLKPNFELIKEISRKYKVIGYHLFTLETLHHSSAHCRNFAPLYDIDEESATGTANAALACYLKRHMGNLVNDQFCFEQGYIMGRPSQIKVHIESKNSEISFVEVGGFSSDIKNP